MGLWETLGVIAAVLVALNGAIDAARGVTLAPVRLYRWLRRAIQAVDVVLSIPERMTRNEQLLTEHIRVAKPQVALLERMADDLGVTRTGVEEVRAEVKNNGGGSLKDSAHRIEAALGLPEPKKNPTTPIPTTRRRTRPAKEPS